MAVDHRAHIDVGGPLKTWRTDRRCPACGSAMVRGPLEICGGPTPHAIELRVVDLRQPLGARQRREVERGYWWRWLLGLLALVCMLLALGCNALVSAGLMSSVVLALVAPVAGGMVLLALLLSPPILLRPTPDQVMRQFRAAEATSPDDAR